MESGAGAFQVLDQAALVAILVVRNSLPASGLLLGRALWRLRVRALMAQKRLLEQQVTERTTELRESHRRLSESRQQLWAAMDAARLGIWSQNLTIGEDLGDEQGPSILGNAAGETVTFETLQFSWLR